MNLLNRSEIRRALQELKDKKLAEIGVTAQNVRQRLYREARFPRVTERRTRLMLTAWLALGRHFGMFQDKLDVNMRVSLEVLVNQAILPAPGQPAQIVPTWLTLPASAPL